MCHHWIADQFSFFRLWDTITRVLHSKPELDLQHFFFFFIEKKKKKQN